MATGKVRRFIAARGFGFITADFGGDDLFFHIKDCVGRPGEPVVGQRVCFDERPNPRVPGKFAAYAVKLLDRPGQEVTPAEDARARE